DACLRATRGTPLLMRLLVDALREEGLAPTAEAAHHVERIGARTVARSIHLRLHRLPEKADGLARALAVVEQGELLETAGSSTNSSELLAQRQDRAPPRSRRPSCAEHSRNRRRRRTAGPCCAISAWPKRPP